MRYLTLKELGVISLVQTIFMFVGLLQIGLLNGGYRIVSLGKREEFEKSNNSIYSYLTILLPFGFLFCVLASILDWIEELSFILLLISVVFGVFTLLNNWIHNALIGEQKLGEVNLINVVSYGTSALMLPFAYLYGFWGGMLVIMMQPFLFVSLAVLRNKELVPTRFFLNFTYINYILSFGFIPFLGGIFFSIYLQVERWSITEVLGVEALGGFYLVFLYVSLFQLIPSSINSIFFPKGIKAYSQKNYMLFKSLLKYYYLALVGYGFFIMVMTFLLLEPVVTIIFPQHIQGVVLVYIILPGLVLQSLSEPIGLILNSAVILRPMLVVNVLNMLFCICMAFVLIFEGLFTLQSVASIRMASGLFILIAYLYTYYIIKDRLFLK